MGSGPDIVSVKKTAQEQSRLIEDATLIKSLTIGSLYSNLWIVLPFVVMLTMFREAWPYAVHHFR